MVMGDRDNEPSGSLAEGAGGHFLSLCSSTARSAVSQASLAAPLSRDLIVEDLEGLPGDFVKGSAGFDELCHGTVQPAECAFGRRILDGAAFHGIRVGHASGHGREPSRSPGDHTWKPSDQSEAGVPISKNRPQR
jgi:hypothetical protein